MAARASVSQRDTSVLDDVGVRTTAARGLRARGVGEAGGGGGGHAGTSSDITGVNGFFGPGAAALAAAAAREEQAARLRRRGPAPQKVSPGIAFALYGAACGAVMSVVLFVTFAFAADMVSSQMPTWAYVIGGGAISLIVGVYLGAAYEWNWGIGRVVGVAGAISAAAVDGLVFRLLTGRVADAIVLSIACGCSALFGVLLGASVEN